MSDLEHANGCIWQGVWCCGGEDDQADGSSWMRASPMPRGATVSASSDTLMVSDCSNCSAPHTLAANWLLPSACATLASCARALRTPRPQRHVPLLFINSGLCKLSPSQPRYRVSNVCSTAPVPSSCM